MKESTCAVQLCEGGIFECERESLIQPLIAASHCLALCREEIIGHIKSHYFSMNKDYLAADAILGNRLIKHIDAVTKAIEESAAGHLKEK